MLEFVFLCGVFSRGVISSFCAVTLFRLFGWRFFSSFCVATFRLFAWHLFVISRFCPFVFSFGVFSSIRVASFPLLCGVISSFRVLLFRLCATKASFNLFACRLFARLYFVFSHGVVSSFLCENFLFPVVGWRLF